LGGMEVIALTLQKWLKRKKQSTMRWFVQYPSEYPGNIMKVNFKDF
jgi:hypothetical protein